jgi:hypothetical protein
MSVTPALATLAIEEIRLYLRRKAKVFAFFGLAAIATLATIGCLLAAAHEAIAQQTDALTADVILAAGMAVIAIVFAVVGLIFQRKPKREKMMSTAAAVGLPLALGLFGRKLPWGILAAGAAAVAGVALGRTIVKKD